MSEKISPDTQVSTTELACVIGVSGRRIRQLAEDGVLDKVNTGKFNLAQSVQRYIAMLNAPSKNEASDKTVARLDAEIRMKEAKAIVAELEAEELQGKMHRSEDVAKLTEDLIYSIRNALMSVPGRCSVDTAEAKTPAQTFDIIRREIYHVMTELANYQYDPQKYEERVRERRAWDATSERDVDDE